MTTKQITTIEAAIAFLEAQPMIPLTKAVSTLSDDIFAQLLKDRYIRPSLDSSYIEFSKDKFAAEGAQLQLKLAQIELQIKTLKAETQKVLSNNKVEQARILASKDIQLRQIEMDGEIRLREGVERIQQRSDEMMLRQQELYLNAAISVLPAIAQVALSTIPLIVESRRIID